MSGRPAVQYAKFFEILRKSGEIPLDNGAHIGYTNKACVGRILRENPHKYCDDAGDCGESR